MGAFTGTTSDILEKLDLIRMQLVDIWSKVEEPYEDNYLSARVYLDGAINELMQAVSS